MRSVFSSESVKGFQLGSERSPRQGAAGMRAVARVLQTSLSDLTNIFFPSDCHVCSAPISALGRVRVCDICLARVVAQTEALCTRCGDALGMESARFAASLGTAECTLCRLAPPAFTRAVAFASYDNETRELLHLLKFSHKRSLAQHTLGQALARAIQTLRAQAADDLIVLPVPLFAVREHTRTFNQSTLLAQAAIQYLRKLEPDWQLTLNITAMQRTRDTRSLFSLAPHQRRSTLKGAFRIATPDAIKGREVLLIDDIMTTGATARECSKTLLRAGAARVWVATVAKAQPETLQLSHHPGDVAMWTATASSVAKPIEPDIGKRTTF